mmetsp:Transcript_587/g.1972  ORF Transcript_587/g.1972 Transcript_587/m.1972 type:complete len:357 (+) Transcript_587:128-1198(+)|eukprot:CAMPEP_0198736000 /NCGR_PEP_ID=MMETSP1475-20131203/62958_1 /TAXON_ID= ORGANISM="Unidentified sp., Strain CCMP1999" /NCGR_SAMPLE_ID=MMETSP1475 /ASSEMBLY_ACC=CAM_ASM_001111 /LENGTH=356 /DNA_ID=CAMNT_0044499745 /DNA_START=91 /DNA_END=1164 /DNA_ORIENTATION=-
MLRGWALYPDRESLRLVLSAAIFVLSGVAQTVSIQALIYHGGDGDHETYLMAIPNYAGNLMVYFIGDPVLRYLRTGRFYGKDGRSSKSSKAAVRSYFHPERRKLFVLAANELIGFACGMMGLALAGSGLYQVVLSGTTVFTTLLSALFLRKRPSVWQWFFVATIFAGLVMAADQVQLNVGQASSVINGVILTLLSCLFYSFNAVITEYFLSTPSDDLDVPPPTGKELSLYTHGTCLFVFASYTASHAITRQRALVIDPLEEHRGVGLSAAGLYIGIFTACFLHAVTYYDLVAKLGAIPVGVMNAVRAVTVFGASAVLFCSKQESQCYSVRKGIVTVVVTIGAVGYSLAGKGGAVQK